MWQPRYVPPSASAVTLGAPDDRVLLAEDVVGEDVAEEAGTDDEDGIGEDVADEARVEDEDVDVRL